MAVLPVRGAAGPAADPDPGGSCGGIPARAIVSGRRAPAAPPVGSQASCARRERPGSARRPAPPAGGRETLYFGSSVPISKERGDLYNALGGIYLVSRVTASAEVSEDGGRRVTLEEWDVWAWDRYDWREGLSVWLPIHLYDRLSVPEPQRASIDAALRLVGIDPAALDELVVTGAALAAIEERRIEKADGTVVHPKAYRIYSDGSWSFDPSGSARGTEDPKERTFLVEA